MAKNCTLKEATEAEKEAALQDLQEGFPGGQWDGWMDGWMDGRSWRLKSLLSQVENKIIIKDLQKSSVLDFKAVFFWWNLGSLILSQMHTACRYTRFDDGLLQIPNVLPADVFFDSYHPYCSGAAVWSEAGTKRRWCQRKWFRGKLQR